MAGAGGVGIGPVPVFLVPNPTDPKRADGEDKGLARIWKASGSIDLIRQAWGTVRNQLPTFTHTIRVAVVGGPTADIRRAWYLACACAFGRYRQKVHANFNNVMLQATWLISQKAVTVEITYSNNAFQDVTKKIVEYFEDVTDAITNALEDVKDFIVGGIFGAAPARPAPRAAGVWMKDNARNRLQAGPQQLTIGATWPGFLVNGAAKPGPERPPAWSIRVDCLNPRPGVAFPLPIIAPLGFINAGDVFREEPVGVDPRRLARYPLTIMVPNAVAAAGVAGANGLDIFSIGDVSAEPYPILPDDGRVITTAEKTDRFVQSPRPPLDGVSRSSLLTLVSQALQEPCFHVPAPICTTTPAASSGRYLYNPGRLEQRYNIVFELIRDIRQDRVAVRPDFNRPPDQPSRPFPPTITLIVE